MIFRKPYAFFIKYFRIINLIMAFLMAVLIYRTFKIGNFLTNYISDYIMATSGFSLGNYINFYIFFLVFLIIILTVVVMSVMIVKNKPKKLYIFNLITYFSLIVLYGVDYSVMHDIYDRILDIRVSKALRDINYIMIGVQAVSFIITLIRATGFDIKGFDFGKDLQQLEIDTKDNEEFEVAIELDKNKINRNVRSKIRNFKYFYVEHKFLINIGIIIFIVLIAFISFISVITYSSTYKENKVFSASTLQFNVQKSYLTNTDKDGNIITDNYLLIAKLSVRKFNEGEKKYLNTGLITLNIGDNSYNATSKYNDYLTDIGTPYTHNKLSIDFSDYIFVFEIPKKDKNKTKKIKINDSLSYIRGQIGAKNIFVNLNPIDLTEKKDSSENVIGDTISFSGSLLEESTFAIKKYEINDKFKVEYDFCSKKENCYKSYEYIVPTATGNYLKTLLRIDGEFEEDKTANLAGYNIADFLNEFATIYYEKDGKWNNHKIYSSYITPKIGEDNYYYIEINKDIEAASSIYLKFNIRNYTYKYMLK